MNAIDSLGFSQRDLELMARWFETDERELADAIASNGTVETLREEFTSRMWEALEAAARSLSGKGDDFPGFDFLDASSGKFPCLHIEDAAHPASTKERPQDFQAGIWRLHVLYPGEPGCPSSPTVEFFDTSQDPLWFPGGQFVTSMDLRTLASSIGPLAKAGGVLTLDPNSPFWNVAPADLFSIDSWLTSFRELPEAQESYSLSEEVRSSRAAAPNVAKRGGEFPLEQKHEK